MTPNIYFPRGSAPATDMTGATAMTDGVHGLAPKPVAGEQGKVLQGDGTWAAPVSASDMTGATAMLDGAHGLAPKPLAGDQTKFLRGDGTWAVASSVLPTNIVESDETSFDITSPGTFDLLQIPIGTVGLEVAVIVDQQFNGSCTLSVGTAASPSKYVATANVNLFAAVGTIVRVAKGNPAITAPEQLIATFTRGVGNHTTGHARIIVYRSIPPARTAPVAVSLTVTPVGAIIPVGSNLQYAANLTYSDATIVDVTASLDCSWSSSNGAKLSVSTTPGSKGLAHGVAVSAGETITAICFGIIGSAPASVIASLVSIAVSRVETLGYTSGLAYCLEGETVTWKAIGTYSDASTADLTTLVAWHSSDDTWAEFSALPGEEGWLTGLSGDVIVDITASLGAITSPIVTQRVTTINHIDIVDDTGVPIAALTAPVGGAWNLTAFVYFNDGTNYGLSGSIGGGSIEPVMGGFSTDDAGVVTVNPVTGVSSVVASGTTNIGINNYRGSSSTIPFVAKTLASIAITGLDSAVPEYSNVNPGNAIGTFADLSTADVTMFVTVSSIGGAITPYKTNGRLGYLAGALVGFGPDSATYQATIGAVIGTLVCSVGYVTSVSVTGPGALTVGNTGSYVADATLSGIGIVTATKYATWGSSDFMVLGVGMVNGDMLAMGAGMADAQATFNRNMGGSIMGFQTVAVTP